MNYTRTKISCYIGYVVQAVINNLLPLFFVIFQTDFNISYTKLGQLVFINFGVQLFVDFASIKISKILGYKKMVLLAHILATLGIAALSFLPYLIGNVYLGIVICIIIYASGSGLIEVAVSPVIEALPEDNKTGNMSFLHSFYCWGQMLTVILSTLLLKVFADSWKLVPLFWALVPFANLFLFWSSPVVEQEEQQSDELNEKQSVFSFKFFVFMLLMFTAGASEISMAQWASMFVEQGLGISKTLGDVLGPALFAVFMGSGRVLYGALSQKIDTRKTMIYANILCAMCYAAAAIASSPVLALVSCALCGFSVSLFWPSILSMGAQAFPNIKTEMFALFALCGDIGCSVGPYVVGIGTQLGGFKLGVLLPVSFPLIAILCLIISKKYIKVRN